MAAAISSDVRAFRRTFVLRRFLPIVFDGEVARRAGGVMSNSGDAHDPSVRFADTSPASLGRNVEQIIDNI